MYELVMPSINKFGAGCIQEIGSLAKKLKLRKALIITDANLHALGMTQKISDSFDKEGIEYEIYPGVLPNPTKKNVEEAVAQYKLSNCDFIVGLGGGSPNDCSKAVGIVVNNGGVINDYEGFNQSKYKAPITFSVNTTAGTASEISRAYLISDEARVEKLIFKDINALPYCSFNDPEMMVGLPAHITAATGMDALTHAIESYVSVGKYPLTQKLSMAAIEFVFENIEAATLDPQSLEIRSNMIYAQTLAGMAFCNAGLGLVHSMAHQLGAVYNLPHGLCNAILLPHVMRFNEKAVASEYAKIARTLFHDTVVNLSEEAQSAFFIDSVETLSKKLNAATHLKDLGVKETDLELLADKTLLDGNLPRNPIQPNKEEIIELFKRAL